MKDLKNKFSMWWYTAYYVWYAYRQVKALLIQHTHSQLETFWTLPVRVVILEDELGITIFLNSRYLNFRTSQSKEEKYHNSMVADMRICFSHDQNVIKMLKLLFSIVNNRRKKIGGNCHASWWLNILWKLNLMGRQGQNSRLLFS